MKKVCSLKRIFLVGFFVSTFLGLSSCSYDFSEHFLKNRAYRQRVEKAFNQKIARVGAQFYDTTGDSLTRPEVGAMHFLYAYMPDGDMIDHPQPTISKIYVAVSLPEKKWLGEIPFPTYSFVISSYQSA